MEALPNLAVPIGILVSVVDAYFIYVHNPTAGYSLQSLLEFLTLEVIPFLIAVRFFLTTYAYLTQRITYVLLRQVVSPQRSQLRLGLIPMLLHKRSGIVPNP
jgi:hypothetical protein